MKYPAWLLCAVPLLAAAAPNEVKQLAPAVYFHEGDLVGHGHCNNGWIITAEGVIVVDANFPSGAQVVIPKIRETTDVPVKFVFDTHHHGDHAYANQLWADRGALIVGHEGVLEEMKKFETGYFGGKPGRWEESKGRPDVAASRLKPPSLLFRKEMFLDDGTNRAEFLHFGTAHTRGDGFLWLPKEKILFTGDACVNGPFNFMGDGDSGQWIHTLEGAQKLGAKIICPGHGPVGTGELLEDQKQFFIALRAEVQKLVDRGMKPEEVKAAAEMIKSTLKKNKQIEKFVGDFIGGQVEKVYAELGGKSAATADPFDEERREHAVSHGVRVARRAGSR